MPTIKWNATKKDQEMINRLATRAKKMGLMKPKIDIQMDIAACHLNGTPLDLEKFLNFDDFNFLHDLGGIARHLNRTTGKIENCFLPRCAKKA